MKQLTIKLSLILATIGLFCHFMATSLQAAEAAKTVRVGIYDNRPKIFRDENGQVTGLYGDILRYIAEQENWQLEFVDGTFDEGLNRLEAGQIDVMVDVAYSDTRAMRFDFTTETVFGSWGVVYVRRDANIDSFTDLNNKTVALLKSSIYLSGPESLDRYIQAFDLTVHFVEADEYQVVFDQLSQGQVDAAVVSRISGLAAEKKYSNIEATNIIFSPTELKFALRKNHPDNSYLISKLDYWVKRLKTGQEDVFKNILQKHDLTSLETKVEIIPQWIYLVILSGGVVIIISWSAVLIFRQGKSMALQSLAEKEQFLSEIVNNTAVILLAINKSGIVTLAEGQAFQRVGLKPPQLVNRSIFEHFPDNKTFLDQMKTALSGQDTWFKTEMMGRIFSVRATPLKTKSNRGGAVIVAIDVTDESKLESAKSEFLTLVQHQLRTPPTTIKWAAELLDSKIKTILDNKEQENWQMIKSANERMINLANSLSLVSEITAGSFVVKPEKFDLKKLLENVINAHAEAIADKKIKVEVQLGKTQQLRLDARIMGVILQSLISNAILYSDPHGLIKIKANISEKKYLLQIEDHGHGVSSSDRIQIFAQFLQRPDSVDSNPSSFGLTLYSAKTILHPIGGKIWFEEKPLDGGNVFTIEIPRSAKN